MKWRRKSVIFPSTTMRSMCENSMKSFSELRVEDGIDDGIECAVGISQPGQDLEQSGWNAILAKTGDDIDDEEGSPT